MVGCFGIFVVFEGWLPGWVFLSVRASSVSFARSRPPGMLAWVAPGILVPQICRAGLEEVRQGGVPGVQGNPLGTEYFLACLSHFGGPITTNHPIEQDNLLQPR